MEQSNVRRSRKEMAGWQCTNSINPLQSMVKHVGSRQLIDRAMALAPARVPQDHGKHPSQEYAWNWVQTYSVPNVETRAATTCKWKIRLYLVPAFERPAV